MLERAKKSWSKWYVWYVPWFTAINDNIEEKVEKKDLPILYYFKKSGKSADYLQSQEQQIKVFLFDFSHLDSRIENIRYKAQFCGFNLKLKLLSSELRLKKKKRC